MTRVKTIAVAALFACVALGATAAPSVITQPDWLKKPSATDLGENYPSLASKLGLAGVATISCSINAQGGLVDCAVIDERPAGLGFGRAAILMSSKFLMRPMTLDGKPVDGGAVRIPLRFAPPTEKAPSPPPPVSPEAERQAYRLVDSMHLVENTLAAWERSAGEIETEDDDQTSVAVRAAASDAMRRAGPMNKAGLRMAYAAAFGSVFSEGEMASLADFGSGPGAAMPGDDVFMKALQPVNRDYWREASANAHAAYCANHACGSPSDVQRIWRPADPRDTARIDNPQWASQPSEAAVSGVRPQVATLLGLAGLVRLTCKATAAGEIGDCQVDEESPTGLGYGDAALTLALGGDYRLSSIQLSDGGAGRKVTVRVGFPAPLQPPPYTAPAGSENARALARKVAGSERGEINQRRQIELELANYAARTPRGADKKNFEAALDAYRAGSEAALARYIDQNANVWSTVFTEAQLATLAEFRSSPAGKAQEERREELDIATQRALVYVYEKVTADARGAFCAVRDCKLQPAPPQPTAVSSEPSARKP